jgi:hypothetical protein
MFAKSQTDSALDREIAAALKELGETRDNPEKYNATLDRIARLEKLKTKTNLQPPTMDTVLIVSANLLGILILTNFEREQPIRARAALGHVFRLK